VGGKALHQWAFSTRTFRTMFGQEGGATGVDDDLGARIVAGVDMPRLGYRCTEHAGTPHALHVVLARGGA
jgi:hypothetical protein